MKCSVVLAVPILLAFLIVGNVPRTNALIDDVLDVLHIGKEVASGVLQAWDVVEQTNLAGQIDLPITREKHKKVLRHLKELSRQIEMSESKYVNSAAWTIESITNYVKINTQLELGLSKLHDIIDQITVRFKQMNIYAKYRNKLENTTMIRFAELTVSPNPNEVNNMLETLFLLYAGNSVEEYRSRRKSMLFLLAENLKVKLLLNVR